MSYATSPSATPADDREGARAGVASSAAGSLPAETLAQGVALLLSFTVVQRLVGFVRGTVFCRWLSPEELGHWDLAFSFLLLAAPLTVLGIPGAFGRYVAYYGKRGQLASFLRYTTLVSATLAILGAAAVFFGRETISWLVFADPRHGSLVMLMSVGLVCVIAFNFLTSLFSALRQMRVVSAMQLGNSLVFAGVGIGLLWWGSRTVLAIVFAYATACLLSSLGAVCLTQRTWRAAPAASENRLSQRNLWAKLMPFAGWIWATNMLASLFVMADRYMIVHWGGYPSDEAAAMVGNYHSSRMIPLLMVAVSGMLSGVILPHISHDWEAGRRATVGSRLNLALKVWGLVLCAGGCAILLVAPLFFGWLLDNKYDGGLAILPLTLVYCVWFSLCLVAQNYLWCAEKAGLVSLVYAAGLLLNVGLNRILLPIYGLPGAVMATAAAMATALGLVYVLNIRAGMRLSRGTVSVALLPISFAAGPWVALTAVTVFTAAACLGEWFLSAEEKRQLRSAIISLIGPRPGQEPR